MKEAPISKTMKTVPQNRNEAEIRELIENWAKAVRAEDIVGITANHGEDIVMFDVPPPRQLKGIDAYKHSWEGFFGWFQNSGIFDLSEISITAGEDVAFCYCLIRCGGTEPGGNKVELGVRLTVCLRKINGRWIITHEHHSEPSKD
jgi:uncharacterized protein (TIGR02246 family)